MKHRSGKLFKCAVDFYAACDFFLRDTVVEKEKT